MELLLDLEDREKVLAHRWWLHSRKRAVIGRVGPRFVNLGRFILDYDGPLQVDHINRNPLDNRKANLRLCTRTQNMMNRGPRADKRQSKYKGVFFKKNKGRWMARLRKEGRQYDRWAKSELHAAQLYNELAKKHFGEFAYLNPV